MCLSVQQILPSSVSVSMTLVLVDLKVTFNEYDDFLPSYTVKLKVSSEYLLLSGRVVSLH